LRIGESTLDVAEQGALYQILWDSSAVNDDKRLSTAIAKPMNELGK